jgi:SsrA-binding protein
LPHSKTLTLMNKVSILNKKASFNYILEQKYTAGIALLGTEVKAIRNHQITMTEAFCVFDQGELWLKNMHISEWKFGGYANHEPLRPRKLLLKSQELRKLKKGMEAEGYTIIPVRLFLNEKGLIKLEIALAKGKKLYDKREDLKKKDTEREMSRKF